MDPLFNVGLALTRWLQGDYPQLIELMTFFSVIGTFEV